jgi:rhomboid family GlyGly-CTERM serine protease
MTLQQPVGRFKVGLSSLNSDGWRGAALLIACAAFLLPEAFGDAGRMALRYERAAIASGQWWRLATAHFVHLNILHAALNAGGLALMWALFMRDYRPGQWAVILIASIVTVDAGLWFQQPNISWYVGASGMLHGAMAAGTWAHLRQRSFDGWILAMFLVGKLAYEHLSGATPLSAPIGPVVTAAHLYGALGGFAAALYNRALFRGGL